MIRMAIVLALVLGGCGKSTSDQLKDDIAKEQARRGPDPAAPDPKPVTRELPPKKEKKEEPPDPEPTTPDEIDKARKKAAIAGKHKDVIKYCEMQKVDEKSDAQVALSCTLAACQVNDADKAKTFAKGVAKSKPLYEQAIKTCMAAKVVL
jgi:hypothetical protein